MEFFQIQIVMYSSEYWDLQSEYPYSVQKREYMDQIKLRISPHENKKKP